MLGSLIAGGASLLSGLGGLFGGRKRDKENAARQQANDDFNQLETAKYNHLNRADVIAMNAAVRARAEKAAKVPIVTTTQHGKVVTKDSGFTENTTHSAGRVDWKTMMADAEKAGFNPVTWLQGGAMAAYTRLGASTVRRSASTSTTTQGDDVTTVTGSGAMDAALAGQYIPSPALFQKGTPAQSTAPTIGEVLGNAISAGASQFVSDLGVRNSENFQREMVNQQLQGVNRSGIGGGRSFYVPHTTTSGGVTQRTGGKPTGPANLYVPYIDNSKTGGGRTIWLPNPDIADSEQIAAAIAASGGYAYVDANQQAPWVDVPDLINKGVDWVGGALAGFITSPGTPRTRSHINPPAPRAFERPGNESWRPQAVNPW